MSQFANSVQKYQTKTWKQATSRYKCCKNRTIYKHNNHYFLLVTQNESETNITVNNKKHKIHK